MSDQMTLLVLGGCALGAVQLVAGVALGMWLRRCDRADGQRGRRELMRASMIAKRLQTLADEMSSSAHAHRAQLDEASQLLSSSHAGSDAALAELVVDVIDDIVRANQNLQNQLTTAESRLEQQAVEIEAHISRSLTDPLTGLPNRREFNDRMEERMSAWKRRKEVFSLLLVDVDHFKKLNDKYGHLVGDHVLATIGRIIRRSVRREDAVARFGGEEFAVLLPSTSLEQAVRVAENVRDAVAKAAVTHNHRPLDITISGGLAAILASDTAQSLIERADAALYKAKASGRNRTCVHDGTSPCSPRGVAEQLAELIQRIDSEGVSAAAVSSPTTASSASPLPLEVISPALAQACDDLRRYIEQRKQPAASEESPA